MQNKETFLSRFIRNKVEDYREPQRAGTPKGDPIGFPTNKYMAVLFHLVNLPYKQVAAEAEVSYGLLRKWRSEGQFLQKIEEVANEFSDELAKHFLDRANRQKRLEREYLNHSIDYIAKNPPPRLDWEEFSDLNSYSDLLIDAVLSRLGKLLDSIQGGIGDENLSPNRLFEIMSLQYAIEPLIDNLRRRVSNSNRESVDPKQEPAESAEKLLCEIEIELLRRGPDAGARKVMIMNRHIRAGNFSCVSE